MLSSLNIRHMRVFVAIAEQGSFSAAAAFLGLGSPAVTATIRQFEDVTGAALFDRTTRQVSLTVTGERFLPVARRLIGDFEEALGDLDALSKGIGGKIRIAAAPSVLTRILPGVIRGFIAAHPDARLRLDELNAKDVHEAVANNEADFGIAGEWQDLPDINFSPLFSDRFGVLCRPDHPFAQETEIAWSELADQPFVGLGPESGTRAMMAGQGIWAAGGGADDASRNPDTHHAVDISPSITRAAALGVGAAQKALRTANDLDRAMEQIARVGKAKQRGASSKSAKASKMAGMSGNAATDPAALLRPVVETSNTITLAAMVAEGVGITVLPELAARIATGAGDLAGSGKLTFVPLCHPIRHRQIGVITRHSKSLSPIARIFLDMVMEQAPKMDLPAAIEWG
ncbi:LysR family transcriptional regulator [Thalassospira lucentensis]|uniref:LysR family transcriptional regulator n=1 Tax=Thalassospira lucentensis TaxID=168935 RepID=UPI003D2EE449